MNDVAVTVNGVPRHRTVGDVPPGGVARGRAEVLRLDYDAISAGCATSSAALDRLSSRVMELSESYRPSETCHRVCLDQDRAGEGAAPWGSPEFLETG